MPDTQTLGLTQRRNHGRLLQSQDDAVSVPALPASWDGVNQCKRLLLVITAIPSELNGQRNSPSVAGQMTFATRLRVAGKMRFC